MNYNSIMLPLAFLDSQFRVPYIKDTNILIQLSNPVAVFLETGNELTPLPEQVISKVFPYGVFEQDINEYRQGIRIKIIPNFAQVLERTLSE